MSPRRPRDKEQTIEDILTAAKRLFSERGLHGTSIRDIETASGVSKGLILHHFESKENLYAAVQEHLLQEYYAQMKSIRQGNQELKELIGAAVRGSFQHTKNNDEYRRVSLWSYLEGQALDPVLEKGFTQNLIDAMRIGQQTGLVRTDVDAAVMPFIIRGAIDYWLRKQALIQVIAADERNSTGGVEDEQNQKNRPPADLSDELFIDALTKLFIK
jgi:AcrR family transcriptional regulator